ncbi:MAG: hypothetical protein EU516_01070 [Promethearchaeota archaeon]|nr:MAG: hypothetical protein EU516_01070 [Candidatus Lokiarchaeota archaeon]
MVKTFEDLIKDVHEKGLCGECGGCVSFCSAGDIGAIKMSESGPPVYANKENCKECGFCYYVCPQTHVLNDLLNDKFEYFPPIGKWGNITSSVTTSEVIAEKATDGGVVTSILNYLLDNKLIDGAIVCKRQGPFNRVPFLATSKEDLVDAAGSYYDLSKQVIGLEKYNTFIPTNTKLKDLINSDLLNIAIVGTPCQIHSIRKMQQLSIIPAHIVKYTLGLFCNVNFSFNDEDRKKMEEKFNFKFNKLEKMNIRDDIIINVKGGKLMHLSFSDVDEFIRPACKACSDFSNVYADLSFGGLGSEKNHTTTIIRTKIGAEIYNNALKNGYIKETHRINSSDVKSKLIKKIIAFSQQKIERAKKFSK